MRLIHASNAPILHQFSTRILTIGYRVFYKCSSLSSVTIPDSVTAIGDWAFYDCADNLTLTVERDSYAAEYAKAKGIAYIYPDA